MTESDYECDGSNSAATRQRVAASHRKVVGAMRARAEKSTRLGRARKLLPAYSRPPSGICLTPRLRRGAGARALAEPFQRLLRRVGKLLKEFTSRATTKFRYVFGRAHCHRAEAEVLSAPVDARE